MTTERDAEAHGEPDLATDLRSDRQLSLALHIATSKVTKAFNLLLEPIGLTFPQYLALLVLWERSPRSVNDVAQALGSGFGSVSPLLQRMEAGGLVRRERDRQDERRVLVHVTDKGYGIREPVWQARRELVRRFSIGMDDLANLRTRLQFLAANLD